MLSKRNTLLAGMLAVTILASSFFSIATPINASTMEGDKDYFIVNPYESVDWDTYGQYKADFHSHTIESDGRNTPAAMIEDHYAKDFDILAITDHNFTNTTWDRTDRPERYEYLTTDRLEEINLGLDRNGRGMIGLSYSNEQSRSDHLNTFFADFNNEGGDTLEDNIARAESLGGISHINHPGRYTGARNASLEEGERISKDPAVVGKYVKLFDKYQSLVGMEIINKKDGDSISDRILWDSILQETMKDRNPVWGFSNDDTHSLAATGFSFNMMLMPENTVDNVRDSMENGTFYAVAKVSKRELGMNFQAVGPTPVIENIEVDQGENAITIEGENYHTIEWIADGEIIARGNTFDLNDYENDVNTYVRAQLKGDGGISFTQPFGVNEYTIDNLIEMVRDLGLNKGQTNSFIVSLENAKKSLEKGKDNYINMFNAFTNKVNSQKGKKISVNQTEELLSFLDEILINVK